MTVRDLAAARKARDIRLSEEHRAELRAAFKAMHRKIDAATVAANAEFDDVIARLRAKNPDLTHEAFMAVLSEEDDE